jgi:hypothetical protein
MAYRDVDADSFWSKIDPAAPAQENRPADREGCYICGKPGHYAIACRLHPARLRQIHGEKCGPGRCTNACRSGDHGDCGFHWCECICHQIPL